MLYSEETWGVGVAVPRNYGILLPSWILSGTGAGDSRCHITISSVVAFLCKLLCLLWMGLHEHGDDRGHLRLKGAVTYSHWGPASMSVPMGLHCGAN